MDPLSATASIIAVLQAISASLSFVNDIRESSSSRAQIAIELSDLYALLTRLKYRVDGAIPGQPWFDATKALAYKDGPLDQFTDVLGQLTKKLKPGDGLKRLGKQLVWTLDKKEVANIMTRVERLKLLVSLALQDNLLSLCEALKEDVSTARFELGEIASALQSIQATQNSDFRRIHEEEQRKLSQWLSPLDFASKQRDIYARHLAGTGEWFISSPEFKAWINASERVLFCPGIPGAGKTVLSSFVIEHLRDSFTDENSVAVACIFCSYQERPQQNLRNTLNSVLAQLLVQAHDDLDSRVVCKDWKKGGAPPISSHCGEFLRLECNNMDRVFILVDALDEIMDDGDEWRQLIMELMALPAHVSLMFTARAIPAIEEILLDACCIPITATNSDVEKYVISRIHDGHRLAMHVKGDPSLLKDIPAQVIERVDGMFLMAKLHMDELAVKNSRAALRKALKNLPKELDLTYDQTMNRIQSQSPDDRELALSTIRWVAYSRIPLTLKELQHAIAADLGFEGIEDEYLPDENVIFSVCAGLLVVDEQQNYSGYLVRENVVGFVHKTIKDYFDRSGRPAAAHSLLSKACMRYLSFEVFSEDIPKTDPEFKQATEWIKQNYCLVLYCALNWGPHAVKSDLDSLDEGSILEFLGNHQRRSWAYLFFSHPAFNRYTMEETCDKKVLELHFPAIFGLPCTTKAMVRQMCEVNDGGNMLETPLTCAIQLAQTKVVQELLEHPDVLPNMPNWQRKTPLILAAGGAKPVFVSRSVTHSVFDRGVSISKNDVDADSKTIIQLLLRHPGIELNAKDRLGRTALIEAAESNNEAAIVELVHHDGVDVNAVNDYGRTALSCAVLTRQLQLIRVLLAHNDIDVNLSDNRGNSPLHEAARMSNPDAVKLLLAHPNIDVNSADNEGRTPLHIVVNDVFPHAGRQARIDVAKMLLAAPGIQVNARDEYGHTPSTYAEFGDSAAIAALIHTAGGRRGVQIKELPSYMYTTRHSQDP